MTKRSILLIAAGVASIVILILLYSLARDHVIGQVEKRVRDAMLERRAFHQYVQRDMHVAYYQLMEEGRLPHGFYAPELLSSSYITRTIQQHYNEERRKEGLPEVSYKMASTNPRNPVNRATDYESNLIAWFNEDKTRTSFSDIVEEYGKEHLLYARPFLAVEQRCLKCHGAPENAPEELRKTYNWTGGFNLEVGDVIAAEIVRSPLEGELDAATIFTVVFLIILGTGMIMLIFNTRLGSLVARRTKELRDSEDRFRALFENAPLGYQSLDENGDFVEVNGTWCNLLGYSKNEVLGRNFSEFIHPDLRESFKEHFPKSKSIGYTLGVEFEMIKKDGSEITVSFDGKIARNKDGSFKQTHCILQDITQRRKAEEALTRSEERFRELTEMLPEAVFETDRDINLTYANRRAFELFGYSDEDLRKGLNGLDLIAPEDRDNAKSGPALRVLRETLQTAEHLALRKDGSTFPMLCHANSIMKDGEFVGFRAIMIDVTEQKDAERALLDSEKLLRSMAENYPNSYVSIIEKDFTIGFTSGHEFKKQNLDPNHYVGLTLEEVFGDQVDIVRKHYERTFDGEECTFELFFDDQHQLYRSVPLRSDDGSISRILAVVENITKRKRAEERLRKSEEKFKTYVSHAPDGIFITDESGHYIDVNEAACNMTGYSRTELLSMSVNDLAEPETLESGIQTLEELMKLGTTESEVRMRRKNGSTFWASLDIVALSENQFMAFCSDITETKRLQELESRAERLETAGTIAGQVAHDFNNLLAPLMAYPELIRDEIAHDHKAHPYLDDIENAARKISDINQDLLTLGRRGHYNQKVVDLNRIVLQAAKEMEARARTVTVQLDICKDLMKIMGGAAQIHRMLTNLIVNAQDAMQSMGTIRIKTENYYADEASVAFGRVPGGEYVRLTVSDNGCGIPEDIIQKILDPFFSTKSADKRHGSGLGLSVVDAVMKDHNGYLDLTSKVGHGTSFFLYFPIARGIDGEEEIQYTAGGTESVLVVDDDDIQREVSTKLLKKLGYKVSSVESGEKAIEFVKKNSNDLLILDMVMPAGIDGTETYRRILDINPNQKAIILSGFSESDRVLEAQRLGAGTFVRKPVTKNVIAAAVKTELDRKVTIHACP